MNIELDDEKLYENTKTTRKNSEDVDSAIEVITQELEKLRLNWTGQDADKFFDNTREFFEKMKGVPMCMRNMGRFIDKANKDIIEKDEEFSKELETEVYEEYIDYEQN